MISVEDVCAGVNSDLDKLGELASRLSEGTDFGVHVHHGSGHRAWRVVTPYIALDTLSKRLRAFLTANTNYVAPDHVYGFVKGRSTLRNASQHLGRECVLRMDISRFFPSISRSRIESALERDGLAPDAAALVAKLATIDAALPIGLSTSPHISNLVMLDTDTELAAYANDSGLTFTRYVDDLIFSGGGITDATADAIGAILASNSWTVNDSKTAFMRRGNRQFVTGLYVGCSDRPRIPRRIKRTMRWIVHHIEKVGYEEYMKSFNGESCGDYPNVLLGWARYIGSVEPRFGTDLYRRFEAALPSGYHEEPEYQSDHEEDWTAYLRESVDNYPF